MSEQLTGFDVEKEAEFYLREIRTDEQLSGEQRRAVARRIAEAFGYTVSDDTPVLGDVAAELGIEL